ncbi:MAG TPA: hypothetical protein IAD19_06350 [Candidatus Egerieicola faecale]|jgi:hypothetical protein|uniref:Uncharacterized protein n=1 Tax=Candidatus Egerieicola faecale TaxID=2840774 RepID=A0A9D1LJK3_9FIRM|nr:hypothetical protein [Candidatus Egerieicola faecale]
MAKQEIQPKPAEAASERAVEKRSFHRSALVLGIFTLLFALVGLVTTIVWLVGLIGNAVNNTWEKEALAEVVEPLVIIDVPAYESVNYLDEVEVIRAGVWQFLLDHPDTSGYQEDSFGNITVPQSDIEASIRQILGEHASIRHQSVEDSYLSIVYDEENQVYYLPTTPSVLPYSCEVLSISKNLDIYTLEVGYIPPGPFWDVGRHLDEEPQKTMIYTLQKVDTDQYVVLSVAFPSTETTVSQVQVEEGLTSDTTQYDDAAAVAPVS